MKSIWNAKSKILNYYSQGEANITRKYLFTVSGIHYIIALYFLSICVWIKVSPSLHITSFLCQTLGLSYNGRLSFNSRHKADSLPESITLCTHSYIMQLSIPFMLQFLFFSFLKFSRCLNVIVCMWHIWSWRHIMHVKII